MEEQAFSNYFGRGDIKRATVYTLYYEHSTDTEQDPPPPHPPATLRTVFNPSQEILSSTGSDQL